MSDSLFKYKIINLLDFAATKTNNELIIETSCGKYCGRMFSGEDSETGMFLDAFFDGFEENRKSIKDESNPKAIWLVDVTHISSGNVTSNLPFVCLFIDQILGVSMGTFSKNND